MNRSGPDIEDRVSSISLYCFLSYLHKRVLCLTFQSSHLPVLESVILSPPLFLLSLFFSSISVFPVYVLLWYNSFPPRCLIVSPVIPQRDVPTPVTYRVYPKKIILPPCLRLNILPLFTYVTNTGPGLIDSKRDIMMNRHLQQLISRFRRNKESHFTSFVFVNP